MFLAVDFAVPRIGIGQRQNIYSCIKNNNMNVRIGCTTLIITLLFLVSCDDPKQIKNETENNISEQVQNPTNKVLLSSEIVWEKLNPARGDKSPQAGTLW